MALLKVIELLTESKKSLENATQNAELYLQSREAGSVGY